MNAFRFAILLAPLVLGACSSVGVKPWQRASLAAAAASAAEVADATDRFKAP
jgi:hypothetical protein